MSQALYVDKCQLTPKQFIDSAWSMIRKSKTPSQVPGALKKKRGTVYIYIYIQWCCGIFSKWCWNLEPPSWTKEDVFRIPHSSGEKTIYLKSPPRFVVSFLQIHHSSRFLLIFSKPLFNKLQILTGNTDGWPWNQGRFLLYKANNKAFLMGTMGGQPLMKTFLVWDALCFGISFMILLM